MSLNVLNATEVLAQLDTFDTVIDARSESEFALDHLPGAANWPTLNDEERRGYLEQKEAPTGWVEFFKSYVELNHLNC